jgi:hypothetical protein
MTKEGKYGEQVITSINVGKLAPMLACNQLFHGKQTIIEWPPYDIPSSSKSYMDAYCKIEFDKIFKSKKGKVMKALLIVVLIGMSTTPLFGQDINKAQSKMERFVSKTGSILKFSDYTQMPIKSINDVVETKIRKIEIAGEAAYFYQISKEDKYDTKVASIEYADLQEVMKAIKALKVAAAIDKYSEGPSYLENVFITEDGFEVGYYVKRNTLQWYINLEKNGKGNTILIKDAHSIERAIKDAIIEIDILMDK